LYIARLQLKGFKSFGGPHDLPLAPGMTAIVGPNGSGKSNLLDALRWVLGDSHASKLRISRQGDLLFQGSASRPQASEAEVAIQMREDTRVCTIRRRVSDSGALSLVDGTRVTLMELDEAKRLWQLAGDRFAFIGQGDVTEVIQQRPPARRMLLESLFGIDAYRKRRTEASDRLSEVKEEYGRLRTFSAELSLRREEIAPAVTKATVARDILDRLEEDRRALYWVRRVRNERAALDASRERERLSEVARLRDVWRGRWERSLAFLEGKLAELSQTRQVQARELDEARNSITNFTRTAYGYGSVITSARQRLARVEEERMSLASKLKKLRSDRDVSSKEMSSLSAELTAAQKTLADAEARYKERQDAIEREMEKRERINSERGELDGQMTALKGRIRSIGASLKTLSKDTKDEPAVDPLREIKHELGVLEKKHVELLGEQETAATRHMDVYARLQETSADLQKNKREASKLANRLSELEEQVQTEVYPRPVQHVLSAARLGRLGVKPSAVIDAFSCPTELASAMEAFLGGRQFWILVDTMDEARICIELLKKNQAGRATFQPLDRSRPRNRDESYRLPGSGVVGWAMKLIASEAHWRPALEHIMGDLLIVEEYKLGQNMVSNGFRSPIVTLDGDVFQPSGSISGGRAQKSGRAIEIKSALSTMERDAGEAKKNVGALAAALAKIEEEEAAAAAKKDSIAVEIRELAQKRSAFDARREEITRERARARSERESMISSLKDAALAYAELSSGRKALDADLAAGAESDAKSRGESGGFKEFREIERLKSAVALTLEKQRSAFVLSERTAADLRSSERSLNELEEDISSREQELISGRSNLARLAKRVAEVVARKRALMEGMAEFGDRYERIAKSRDRRASRLEVARSAHVDAAAALGASETSIETYNRERAELIQTWDEQYPYPGPDAVRNDLDPDELRRGIRERDRDLRALGEVDMGSLSEDRSLRDRLAYLGDQLDDVGKSMIELERLISDADEQARSIFTDAMEEIDRKFNFLFQRLFGGGDAKLDFIEGASLWDSGVDVVARPPGKHPQSIAQLSGGEQSLSAIALLFASLQVANSPIAVLDEVDAALDEVNLRRFADLAREAAGERQIFVMTHRRVTMERADVLYGVTLAEPGLSQVIGVRVEEWA
jgi:chromosome segregation protein